MNTLDGARRVPTMVVSIITGTGGLTALILGIAMRKVWWVGGGDDWFELGATVLQLGVPIGFMVAAWLIWPRKVKPSADVDK